jgi:hypothetical protein
MFRTRSIEKDKIFLWWSLNFLWFRDDEFNSGRNPIPNISISLECTVFRKKRNLCTMKVLSVNHENISMCWTLCFAHECTQSIMLLNMFNVSSDIRANAQVY